MLPASGHRPRFMSFSRRCVRTDVGLNRHGATRAGDSAGRAGAACAAKKTAPIKLEPVGKVDRGTTPHQRNLLLPWHKPWKRKVLWNGMVPQVTARARAHGNDGFASAMRPCIAAEIAVIEPAPQTCLSRRRVDTITEVDLVTQPR